MKQSSLPPEVYSRKVRAGKRTYIFDVRQNRNNDYFLTITERKLNGEFTQKQKLFLYKEDFDKFAYSLLDVLAHIKSEFLPDYDFGAETLDRVDDAWRARTDELAGEQAVTRPTDATR